MLFVGCNETIPKQCNDVFSRKMTIQPASSTPLTPTSSHSNVLMAQISLTEIRSQPKRISHIPTTTITWCLPPCLPSACKEEAPHSRDTWWFSQRSMQFLIAVLLSLSPMLILFLKNRRDNFFKKKKSPPLLVKAKPSTCLGFPPPFLTCEVIPTVWHFQFLFLLDRSLQQSSPTQCSS